MIIDKDKISWQVRINTKNYINDICLKMMSFVLS